MRQCSATAAARCTVNCPHFCSCGADPAHERCGWPYRGYLDLPTAAIYHRAPSNFTANTQVSMNHQKPIETATTRYQGCHKRVSSRCGMHRPRWCKPQPVANMQPAVSTRRQLFAICFCEGGPMLLTVDKKRSLNGCAV